MVEIFDKLTIFLITSVLLFIAPVLLVANRLDMSSQTFMDTVVVGFVDNVRVTGQISLEEYEKMVSIIDMIQPSCDISIVVSQKEVMPMENGEVYAYYREIFTNELLEEAYREESVYLNSGDYIQVTVNTTQPTTAQRMLMTGSNFTPLYITYGGYIGNNPY